MTLADKIIMLRKKQGWSQEELADKLDVTRQSVSKWESAQSVPDIGKIIQLSELFSVSTDYLLKDEIDAETSNEDKMEEIKYDEKTEEKNETKKISVEMAVEYLAIHKETAKKIAFAVFLCVISPICMLMLIGLTASAVITAISPEAAVIVGVITILLIVAVAVAIFISCGVKTKDWEYIEKEHIELDENAKKSVKATKDAFAPINTKNNIIGVILCILAAIPTILGAISEAPVMLMTGISFTLLFAAIGAYFFVSAGVPCGAMDKLLEEGEYTKASKENNKKLEPISGVYWLIVTAIYLGYSFITNDWGRSWIVWPVSGVLFGVVCTIMACINKKEK